MTDQAVPPDVERRLRSLQDELDRLSDTNRRLADTLREARNQIVTLKEEVDRLADPPNGFARVPRPQRRRHGRHPRPGPQAAGSASRPGSRTCVPGQEVMVNEAMNVIAGMAYERVGEIVMFKELLEGGDRALVIGHTDEERVVRLAQTLRDQTIRAGDSLLMDPRSALRLRADPEVRGRGARARGGPRRRLLRHRWPGRADRDDPRRRRAALRARRAVHGAQAGRPEGDPALRPARMRQDDDRQGGGRLAGPQGRRARGQDRRALVLPEHQGPGAAQQVRRRDRAAHPAGVPAGPGEGHRGHARSSCSSTRWTRCSAPAAPGSARTSRTRSCRSCSRRSTGSRAWPT